jgi:epsilon-lactone hydrolase
VDLCRSTESIFAKEPKTAFGFPITPGEENVIMHRRGCLTTTVPTGEHADLDEFFRSLLDNPPFPSDATLEQQRDIMDAMGSMNPPVSGDIVTERIALHTGASAERIVPSGADPARSIVYVHGGAFVNGRTPSFWRYPVSRIAAAAEASLLYVLHRLAPEFPFPAARDDVIAGYEHLVGQGHDPAHIVFVADSAGVNIALTALLALREAGRPLPAGFVGIGGWIDLTDGDGARASKPVDPLAIPAQLQVAAQAYLGGRDARSPEANPLFADLSGLPPIRLLVGGREALIDDTTRFSARACEAGIEVHVETWEGLHHGWYIFAKFADQTEPTYRRMGDLIRQLAST